MPKQILISCFLLISALGFGQNQLGLHLDNYSGATGIMYNPASFQLGFLKWDVTVVAGGAFVETEYMYFENTHVSELLFADNTLIDATFLDGAKAENGELFYRFVDAHRPMNNSVYAFAQLPSVALRLNRKTSVGFYSRTRVAFVGNNVSPMWSYPQLQTWPYNEPHYSAPIKVSSMFWTEIALNAARETRWRDMKMSVGATVKYLIGHDAMYAHVPSATSITLHPRAYTAETFEAYYGFTDFQNGTDFTQKGNGLGVDIGLVLQKPESQDRRNKQYRWKASVSLLDVGRIKYTVTAENHHVHSNRTAWVQRASLDDLEWMDEFARAISNDVMGGPTASLTARDFMLITPTRLSLAFDYKLTRRVYANVSALRRVNLHPQQMQSNQYVAGSVRYESKRFAVGLPLLLYNDVHLRMGTWVRIGPLTIGSENLASWFIKQGQLTGTDVYFALRINENTFAKRQKRRTPEDCYW